ncbi:alpha-N-acetylgalactosaminide alpha-2,6-sialyltransferase 5 isoform X1 [Ahaetulla prasina]|uniref:alpha-N-acetylgalactosaminide alpha-2,6-sialyltransferase 5 isoform X1 n=1 Tax=Ahaetulla prasina TaxID=499056 RepID=UPI0026498CF9|nr:alpha-N-acetylgalactosaminide alpha-2,6-sialyltransferase 5 isoform X1 [Ahaetulla prasina]
MKTLVRHGLAVSLALTTMCTSLLLMYGSIGSGGSGGNDGAGGRRALKEQVQQQVAATTPLQKPDSQQPFSTASPRPFPGLADRLLEGYISVLDHKIMLERRKKCTTYNNVFLEKIRIRTLSWQVSIVYGESQSSRSWLSQRCFFKKPLKMHCTNCALVTSSGHLLRSHQGKKIDQTECVIRMNDAPTRGFGKDVGNKTTLRVIAHSSIQRILRNRNELLNMSHGTVFIFWGPSMYMRRDGKGLIYNNLQLMNQILPQLKVYMISRHKMLHFDDLFKQETGKDRKISNTWLSTGWFTMSIALELCDKIDVYGMVPPDFCRDSNHPSVPYHYYEPLGPDECTMYISHERGRKGSHHRFITEKRVFENWARTFDIHFFQPDWKPEALPVNHAKIKVVF